MKNIDSYTHVRGESVYLDDIPLQAGTLFAALFDSPIAHGKIKSLNISEASMMPEVVKIFTARDIPGETRLAALSKMKNCWQIHRCIFAECLLRW